MSEWNWQGRSHDLRPTGAGAGGQVVRAEPSPGSGFSGSFAAVLHLRTGGRVFAKAGSDANPHLLEAFSTEATVLAALPTAVPAPRLLGTAAVDAGDHEWQVLVTQVAPGRLPQPWTDVSLDAVHTGCLQVADALTPPPPHLQVPLLADLTGRDTAAGWFARLACGTERLTWGQPAWVPERARELDVLARGAERATTGSSGVHCDLRADNVLVDDGPGGTCRATFVDWNWLRRGAAWVDFVGLLPLAHADGLDADAWLRSSPLTREVDPDAVDSFLALIAGMMLDGADLPVWPGGPALVRVHQRRYARTFLDWLAHRRAWG